MKYQIAKTQTDYFVIHYDVNVTHPQNNCKEIYKQAVEIDQFDPSNDKRIIVIDKTTTPDSYAQIFLAENSIDYLPIKLDSKIEAFMHNN